MNRLHSDNSDNIELENALKTLNSFQNDLKNIKELVYDQCDFRLTNPQINMESKEYGACKFLLNKKAIEHRVSKITPTKNGQFVAIWKRNKDDKTEPYDILDPIDFIVITAKKNNNLGQFIFPKGILADKGIITANGKRGKCGIRVYPPWDITESNQAQKTQIWQTKYFLTIKNDHSTDLNLARTLFG